MLIGVIFVLYPAFSNQALSMIAGISLIAFGFSVIIDGISLWDEVTNFSIIKIVIGICAIFLGFLFVCEVDTLSFLVAYQSYLIGFLMIIIAIVSFFTKSLYLRISSLGFLIVGVIFIYLGVYALKNPIYVAVLVGITLILEGIMFFKYNSSEIES